MRKFDFTEVCFKAGARSEEGKPDLYKRVAKFNGLPFGVTSSYHGLDQILTHREGVDLGDEWLSVIGELLPISFYGEIDYMSIVYEDDFLDLDFITLSTWIVFESFDTDRVFFYLRPNLEEWNKSFSYKEFRVALNDYVSEAGAVIYHKEDEDKLLTIQFEFPSKYSVGYSFLKMQEQVKDAILNSIKYLNGNQGVPFKFSFPEESKAACEQYLMYFGQFLSDLGIESKTSLEETAQEVLFTVTPDNPNQALTQIKDALDVYLGLAANNNLVTMNLLNQDVSVQQLAANAVHLRSQLMLSHSIIQNQNATIKSLEYTNGQYLKELGDKDKGEEEVLDGLVSVKKYDSNGFSINLPELFRRMFRRKKEK